MKRRLPLVTLAAFGLVVAMQTGASARAGIIASATGGYQVTLLGEQRAIEFTARTDSANVSDGEGQFANRDTGTRFHLLIFAAFSLAGIAAFKASGT